MLTDDVSRRPGRRSRACAGGRCRQPDGPVRASVLTWAVSLDIWTDRVSAVMWAVSLK